MSTDLKKQMESYSNERILNNIKQQEFFSPEIVAIAKEIALERNLLDEEKINQIDHARHETQKRKSAQPYEPRSLGGNIGIGAGLIIVFFILRILLRMMDN